MHMRKDSKLHLLNPARRAALAALGAAMALSLAHPASSDAAGTYIHQSCVSNEDLGDATSGWHPFATAITGISADPQCPGGGLHTSMFVAGRLAQGEGAGWRYTAPSGTTISRITGYYAGWTRPWDGTAGLIQVADGQDRVGVQYHGSVDPSHQRSYDWYDLKTTAVTLRTICDPASTTTCTDNVAWASFYAPRLYLADETPPTAGFPSGTLLSEEPLEGDETFSYSASDDGGGIARLRVYVDGARTIDHRIGDTTSCVPSGAEDGVWVFARSRPCAPAVSGDETIDTTKMADGYRTISVRVVDAAQQETTLWSGRRLVANHPPSNAQLPSFRDNAVYANPLVGTPIEALNDGTWNGPELTVTRNWTQCDAHGSLASCADIPGATGLSYTPTAADVGHRLRLHVTAKNAAGEREVHTAPTGIIAQPSSAGGLIPKPVTADGTPSGSGSPAASLAAPSVVASAGHALRGQVVGEASGTGCPQDKATLKFEHVSGGKLKLGFGRTSSAQVQLMCTNNGKPIAAAQLDVVTRVRGARDAVASDVVTDGAGHATLRLAAGAGRSIAVGYRMYADDPIARATATLKVETNGRVRLRGNHRTLHNGRALTLRGRLLGGHVPARGVTMTVQWKDHSRWRPFAQIKTNKKGTFKYAYKFTRTSRRVTYRLRVQVSKGQLDYPFLPAASNPVKVTVAP